ncbi:NAD(P)-binding protein [Whalleya microplaca]|nr:NAD(P)-binding protein [Whalleya microplaca]
MTTNVFISGISRGLGKSLAESYLLRPHYIVIGSVRDSTTPSAQELNKLPAGTGSRLVIVSIESTSDTDVPKAVKAIEAAGVTHLDLVIANAGICPTPGPLDALSTKDVLDAFQVNAIGTIHLFHGLKPLLEKAPSSPKWCYMSTGAASLARLDVHQAHGVAAYGMTKAAANFFTLAIHSANKWLTVFAIHPGLVQTEMGNTGARMAGMEKAPNTVEESTEKSIAVIDSATRDAIGGRFINVIDGSEFPW